MCLIHSEINQLSVPCEHTGPETSLRYAGTYNNLASMHYIYGLYSFWMD